MRHFPNWLQAYIDYASFSEAPKHMHFWTGVSTVAGVLRRKCWIDQAYFKWYPNFYVTLVAPPGIVSKSTTVAIGMDLLRRVPGVHFGPEIVTWQALASRFCDVSETFEYPTGMHNTMSALTIESSEFGNLLNPQDKEMVDILVTLWDGKSLNKETKHSGKDEIVNPWINLIACTTPSWIAGNFPEYLIGGGLTSRMIFVYAEEKEKYVAYPADHVPPTMKATGDKLVEDLERIGQIAGPFELSKAAKHYGEAWYEYHYKNRPPGLDDERFGGYIARKQTHIHKLAIVLSASERSDRIIEDEHLATANRMVSDLEEEMALVFSKIGKTDESFYADRIINFLRRHGETPYFEVYRFIYSQFPSLRNFEDILNGLVRAKFVSMGQRGGLVYLRVADDSVEAAGATEGQVPAASAVPNA